MFIATFATIHMDDFSKNKFNSYFTNPFTKMDWFGRVAREKRYEFMHTTNILEIGILAPSLYDRCACV